MWIPIALFVIIISILSKRIDAIPICIVCVGVAIYPLWRFSGIKKVRVEGESLTISNWLRSIQLPLDQISSIHEIRTLQDQLACISLKSPCRFGNRIIYLPPLRVLFSRPHPDVVEFEEYIESLDNKGLKRDGQEAAP